MKALLRISALTLALVFASLANGYAVSDFGTCTTYCYDPGTNQTTVHSTYIDFDGCCGNQDSICGSQQPHSHFSARYYFFEGDC